MMRTLVYQVASSIRLEAAGDADGRDEAVITTPIVRPSIDDRIALQGEAFDAITVDRPYVTFSIIPFTSLAQLGATLNTTRFSIQGGQGLEVTAANPSGDLPVSGILVQNRGIITHDAEYEGVFQDKLTITNNGAAINLQYITSVFTQLNNFGNDSGDDLMRKRGE